MIFWSRSSKLKKYSQHKFTNVLIAILIIFIGLTPWLLSLWVRHNSTTQTRERIAAARLAVANRPCQLNYKRAIELIYKPSVIRSEISLASTMRGLIICAINPKDPSKGCPYYKAQTIDVRIEKI